MYLRNRDNVAEKRGRGIANLIFELEWATVW
jgi:hypothetical protein